MSVWAFEDRREKTLSERWVRWWWDRPTASVGTTMSIAALVIVAGAYLLL